jgi:hypothetical protein
MGLPMSFEVGTQYYVTTTGSDLLDSLSRANASATIAHAYRLVAMN